MEDERIETEKEIFGEANPLPDPLTTTTTTTENPPSPPTTTTTTN